ncbi:MAG: protein-export membrane protein SecF [Candidatus Ryanbacteria bacterium RIFCSPHIGHO2_02_FULL_45_17b]|uniref:Protein-export membrane protein SecF n=1 Tax=Candidatus Ryanbacteria bacterium RIFCSPHIGHO2_01_FULL_45_22 TaxID=1802114 RepID=A0A1G2G0Y5_9BACT|nr:MAG: protein-export membrane protein SecF [Candidatus Ryanbacteria bacterium RIFCSPHIGHO2_01_FULL_45_22]OGZ47205.1 MAG: protein-export membrane protein SecF [Candidatus Ryanbacteria bacterium RIFCSPHIGHO2_02_FULL_45_17b]
MDFVALRKVFYMISGALVLTSGVMLAVWGLPLGIDFTGGSLMELEFSGSAPSQEAIDSHLAMFELGDVQIQQTGQKGIILRMRDLDEETHQQVLGALRGLDSMVLEKRFVSVGPVIGSELKRKAVWALVLVLVMIIAYIAVAFRHVSHPISSWKYGVVAIIALIHDVAIPTGLFVYLGRFHGVEINALFISALLTILGFSVHDTIVVFDRVRENLRKHSATNFAETVHVSIHETIVRSINTSLTLILVLLTLFFLGGESTKYFSLALLVGTIAGTYSSIFIASPLLVTWQKWQEKKVG